MVFQRSFTFIADLLESVTLKIVEHSQFLRSQACRPATQHREAKPRSKQVAAVEVEAAKGKEATYGVLLLSSALPGFGIRFGLRDRNMMTSDTGLLQLTLDSDVWGPIFLFDFWTSIETGVLSYESKVTNHTPLWPCCIAIASRPPARSLRKWTTMFTQLNDSRCVTRGIFTVTQ
jgi:hypothetical protein